MKSILKFKRAGATLIAVGLLGLAGVAVAVVSSLTTEGTWVLFPGQADIYRVTIQQPINADGSSKFSSNRGVIPIKFALESAVGQAYLTSILSDSDPDNNFGLVRLTLSTDETFADITNLDAQGAFEIGENHGGSLRWQLSIDMDGNGTHDGNMFIHYGDTPSLVGGSASGNIIPLSGPRYDLGQLGGSPFTDYSAALALAGPHRVLRATLVVDGGWWELNTGDQKYRLDSATVNDNTFTPEPAGAFSPAAILPEAEVHIFKISGANSGVVNEAVTIQSADNDGLYRVVGAHYMYNLDVSSLSGAGVYEVSVVINGVAAEGVATFELK